MRGVEENGAIEGCVAMESPNLKWNILDCMLVKDFICEQTRCYYYNYGSIPVSATQGNQKPYNIITTTGKNVKILSAADSKTKLFNMTTEDNIIFDKRGKESTLKGQESSSSTEKSIEIEKEIRNSTNGEKRHKNLPNIATLFTDSAIREDVFAGLETHEVRSAVKYSATIKYDSVQSKGKDTELTDTVSTEDHTLGPYDSIDLNFQADQADYIPNYKKELLSKTDDDSSTTVPEVEPFYKYNIKVRNNGKVLESAVN